MGGWWWWVGGPPTHHHPPSEFPEKRQNGGKWWVFPELFLLKNKLLDDVLDQKIRVLCFDFSIHFKMAKRQKIDKETLSNEEIVSKINASEGEWTELKYPSVVALSKQFDHPGFLEFLIDQESTGFIKCARPKCTHKRPVPVSLTALNSNQKLFCYKFSSSMCAKKHACTTGVILKVILKIARACQRSQ